MKLIKPSKTAKRTGNRKNGTALITGAIPPNLKLFPCNGKLLHFLAFFILNHAKILVFNLNDLTLIIASASLAYAVRHHQSAAL